MIIKIIAMCPIQHYKYEDGIDDLLVLLIGGIPMQIPTIPFILHHVPFQSSIPSLMYFHYPFLIALRPHFQHHARPSQLHVHIPL
ncbi:hypothetical protein PVL29_019695 [Vitis rotundifolia]|uniref:Uncharacterized protein n=1 Tax=Vitis rotundifolia TaxID=103349 RepID=A0AA38Z1V9_VITRO|nr:hypothetical protein PVL29_019695 [Vitis rotundifolia]